MLGRRDKSAGDDKPGQESQPAREQASGQASAPAAETPSQPGTTGAAPAEGSSSDAQAAAPAADGPAQKTAEKPSERPAEKPAEKPAKKAAEKPATGKDGKDGKDKTKDALKAVPALVRTRVAQAVWLLCVLAALFLALGALVIALDFNQQNAAVEFVLNGADAVTLGVFTRQDGIKEFTGENAATKNALVNYGVGAVFWIVVGRVADRFIRP